MEVEMREARNVLDNLSSFPFLAFIIYKVYWGFLVIKPEQHFLVLLINSLLLRFPWWLVKSWLSIRALRPLPSYLRSSVHIDPAFIFIKLSRTLIQKLPMQLNLLRCWYELASCSIILPSLILTVTASLLRVESWLLIFLLKIHLWKELFFFKWLLDLIRILFKLYLIQS